VVAGPRGQAPSQATNTVRFVAIIPYNEPSEPKFCLIIYALWHCPGGGDVALVRGRPADRLQVSAINNEEEPFGSSVVDPIANGYALIARRARRPDHEARCAPSPRPWATKNPGSCRRGADQRTLIRVRASALA